MNARSLTSWGCSAVMLAAIGCGGGTAGTGAPGGNAGRAGATGTAGTLGAAGHGAAGATGSAGTTGAAGATGSAGATGAAGATGSAGATGAAGTLGSAGSGGGAGQSTAGASGAAGTTGGAGTTGAAGAGDGLLATLLVDADQSDNNDPTIQSPVASASDTLFASLLAGEQITYSTFVVPSDTLAGPTYAALSNVSTIVWYTGDARNSLITSSQQTTLTNWLDLGSKTLIIFSENLVYDLSLDWTYTNSNTFVITYLGLLGGVADVSTALGSLEDVSFVATGNAAVPAFDGLSWAIDADANVSTTADAVNPATGTDVLITAPADPTGTGTDSATPVASGHTQGTSKIVYVGIPIEAVHGAPTNTSVDMFHACLKYTGLKTN